MGWRLELLIVGAVAAAVAWATTGVLVGVLARRRIVDVPNQRSSHDRPTPRGGGLGLLAGFLAALALGEILGYGELDPVFLVALGLVAGIGWLDDVRDGVPWPLRLGVHVAAAALVVWRWGPLDALPLPMAPDLPFATASEGVAGWVLSLLWIVAVVNITNFLDGIDGYAAGQGVLAGAGLAVVGWALGASWLLVYGVATASACLGFLPHNWQPAQIFLGDVGSSALGFALAAAPWAAGGDLPDAMRPELLFLVAMLLWIFLADGVFTLVRRAFRGERVWRAHREHLYQRLVRTGWSHAATVRRLLLVATPAAAAAAAGVALRSPVLQEAALSAVAVSFVPLVVGVGRRERHQRRAALQAPPDQG